MDRTPVDFLQYTDVIRGYALRIIECRVVLTTICELLYLYRIAIWFHRCESTIAASDLIIFR